MRTFYFFINDYHDFKLDEKKLHIVGIISISNGKILHIVKIIFYIDSRRGNIIFKQFRRIKILYVVDIIIIYIFLTNIFVSLLLIYIYSRY